LVAYVCLQFAWWAFMLLSLNNEISNLKTELMILNSGPESAEVFEFKENLHKRWIMIAGEGTVFIILLTFGIIKTHRTFKKEIALSEQQKNFLLSITHELKSPLASNKLQLQTLLKHELSREKQLVLLSAALHDAERLIKLTDNLLLAAKIESLDFTLFKEETNISALITQIFSLINKEKINVKLDIQPDISLKVDRFAFPSIVLNLYENAKKYSEEGSPVTVSLIQQGQKILLSCSDQGYGISGREKNNVFKKFYRIGCEETRKTPGTGLGLYIVKSLVEKHQGQISVKDNKPKGTVFEINFNQTEH
jgi:two-component system, OmpR family, phosphate regulon sensor histidine kinase PhoR